MAASAKEPGSEQRSGSQSVERTLAILQLFRTGPSELGITDIARQTGLNLSTAHRIVRALCAEQFMEQDPDNERYRLGASLFVLGQRALEHSGYSAAIPVLEQLAHSTGESVTLGVRRANEIVVVLTSVSRQRLRFEHPAGSGIGLHASAMGKAVLAFSTAGVAAAVADLPDLERYTDATITLASALEDELNRVREMGYAVNREERYDGVCGVGAPVLNRLDVAEAAIGVQGPSIRMLAGGLDTIGPIVRRAADEVAEVVLHIRSAAAT